MALFGAIAAPFFPAAIVAVAAAAIAHPDAHHPENLPAGLAVFLIPALAVFLAIRAREPKLMRFWWAFFASEFLLFVAGILWGDFEGVHRSPVYIVAYWVTSAAEIGLLTMLVWNARNAIVPGALLSVVLVAYWFYCWSIAEQVIGAAPGAL